MKLLFTILGFAFCINARAQFITTIAGNGSNSYSGDGGLSIAATLHYPYKICSDAAGNIYFGDCTNHCVRKINVNGIITTIAGTGIKGYWGDKGAAIGAELCFPSAVYVDAAGNIYIGDTGNNCIRKVDVNGIITTIAGTGGPGYSGDGGPAILAELQVPIGVIADASGNVFIADCGNHRIRKVDANGIITTIAGTGLAGFNGDGGLAGAANLNSPVDLTLDPAGNLLICEADNYRVRKIDAAGIITTIAGNGNASSGGDGGPAVNAGLNGPVDVDLDNLGNIYITEQFNNCIRKIDANGIINTIAGTGAAGYSGDGGQATAAELNWPTGLAHKDNKIYIVDELNHRIRMICSSTVAVTVNASDTTIGCPGNSATLTASGANTYTYTWSTQETGKNNITVTPTATGPYYVQGRDINGCVGSSSVMLYVDPCVDIAELPKGGQVNIYPNPAISELNISGIGFGNDIRKITIVNSLGQVVRSVSIAENVSSVYKIDIADLKSGLYIVTVENDSITLAKLLTKRD